MKKFIVLTLIANSVFSIAQDYVGHMYIGFQGNFGKITNHFTNNNRDNFEDKISIGLLEFGAEGMADNVFVSFKTHFLGVLPDYMFKALNKNNRAQIYGETLESFYDEYNTVPQQYDYNASFSDWDVLGGSLSYGKKYVFGGVNFAWASTNIKAYQSVNNIKILKQKPAGYYGFNSLGNFTYGANIVLTNGNPDNPIRLICAYDWMMMRIYGDNSWDLNAGNRLSFDLQGNLPFRFFKDKLGAYLGAAYRSHNIDWKANINGVEFDENFKSGIFSFRLGVFWD